MDEEEEKKKDVDIVSGDGSELNISPVYDHIILDKPDKTEKKEKIVIPSEIKEKKKDENEDKEENNNTDSNS